MPHNYSVEEIKKNVEISLGVLFINDSFLLQESVHERSVAHKLAEYLQTRFPDWNVDCEYDKKGLSLKTLEGIHQCSDQRRTDRVLPDIIIHKRNTRQNLLVVEAKLGKDDTCDVEKLKKFTSVDGDFGYKLGVFIKFNSTEEPSLRWFEKGNEEGK